MDKFGKMEEGVESQIRDLRAAAGAVSVPCSSRKAAIRERIQGR